ncbi:hypothetical protein J2X36_005179 [Methylobacterium sp. BE186]|uniref:hypothetical protein n=1 Tax=Methylobacterium sp. BE186 TaxID=2817715 RepID=UPI002866F64D|nr:hypothetical protein [Methylobacterium sp. BE186]MDR7040396.1 hypothetical protein [Methylobacterium sp. BE186]
MAQQIQPDRPIWPSIPETGLPPLRAPLGADADGEPSAAPGLGGPRPAEPQAGRIRTAAPEGFASFES